MPEAPEPKSTRKQVFDAIDGERRYQDLLPLNRSDKKPLPVPGEMILMHEYLARAGHAYSATAGDAKALECIRKVISIGVRCLENHGVIERQW